MINEENIFPKTRYYRGREYRYGGMYNRNYHEVMKEVRRQRKNGRGAQAMWAPGEPGETTAQGWYGLYITTR